MALNFYTSVTKGSKLNVKVIVANWLIPTFVEATGGKLVEGAFFCSPSPSPLLDIRFYILQLDIYVRHLHMLLKIEGGCVIETYLIKPFIPRTLDT